MVAAVIAVLVLAAVAAVLVTKGGGDSDAKKKAAQAQPVPGPSNPLPAGGGLPLSPPKELKLLGNRLVVAPRPGWAERESSNDTATVQLALKEPGRELLATLVIATLPAAGSLDRTLQIDGGTPFEVPASGGPLKATASPGPTARVVAGAVRPKGTYFLSLSVTSLDGKAVEVPTLRKLFTEQVVPALKFS